MGAVVGVLIGIGLFYLVTRPLVVIVHELGHAISHLIISRKKVEVYIGSYGDQGKSFRLRFGLLVIWVRRNPFKWYYGLCVPSETDLSANQAIVSILAGPIAVVFAGLVIWFVAFAYDLHIVARILSVVFVCISILDLMMDLDSRSAPVKMFDGTLCHSDGYKINRLNYIRKFPKIYEVAAEHYNNQEYAKALFIYRKMLKKGVITDGIGTLALSCCLQDKNYNQAKDIINSYIDVETANANDLVNVAITYSHLHQHEKALEHYDKSLSLDEKNKYALNNKGFTLNEIGRYEEAIDLFDKALEIDSTFAYSFNNRGLAKIKTGKSEEGLEDINKGLELENDNSYAFRNLGIYHLDSGNYEKAIVLLRKAQKLDSSTYKIDQLIEEAENYLKK